MRHITSCFFCGTPYQLIAAISIVRKTQETADLYIVFDSLKNYIEEIKNEDIFSQVVFVEKIRVESTVSMVKRLKILKLYIQCDKIAKEILIPDTIYDKQYFSSKGLEERLCFFYFSQKNIPIKRILFDDGLGSYINEYYTQIGIKEAFIRRLLFGKKSLQPISLKMLYSPDLYEMTSNSSDKYNIKKIDGEFNNKETIRLFNRIFHFEESDIIKEKLILLDCMKEEILDTDEQKKLLSIYNSIFQTCGKQNIIIKPHPRDNVHQVKGIKYYTNYKMPLECLYMNMNCSEKILIAVSSTAVVTPKLLFDQEPYVILLYKLLKIKRTDMNMNDLDKYYINCKNLYRYPERFMIPESEEELNECFKRIKN